MRILKIFIGILLVVLFAFPSFASEDSKKYSIAVKAAKSGQTAFAFMNFRGIVRDFPKSKYRQKALFAEGEYLFSLPDLPEAKKKFNAILKEYPEAEGKLFALAYLLRIAQIRKDKNEQEKYKKEIVAFKRTSLLFEESKEIEFLSPLFNEYTALFFIDRVEFYVGKEFFTKMDH